MKHAYLSLVLISKVPFSVVDLRKLDQMLSRVVRLHEIVVVLPYSRGIDSHVKGLNNSGPVTLVYVHERSSRDRFISAGLTRVVGDFVLEWHGTLSDLTDEDLSGWLEMTSGGMELLEILPGAESMSSRFFYSIVNRLRSSSEPVRRVVGRLYSRHALEYLISALTFEPQIAVLVSETPVARAVVVFETAPAYEIETRERLRDGVELFSKGSRFGTVIPLALSLGSATIALIGVLYAVGVFLLSGETPQGWTTLMVLLGLGLASVLFMMGLIWSRIDALTRGLSRQQDPTALVTVIPPQVDEM